MNAVPVVESSLPRTSPQGLATRIEHYHYIVQEPKTVSQPTTIDKVKKVAGYALIILAALLVTGAVLTLGAYAAGVMPLGIPITESLFMAGLAALLVGVHLATNKKIKAGATIRAGLVTVST